MEFYRRAAAGVGFELLAALSGVVAAIALSGDRRATAIHIISSWIAAGFSAIPFVSSVLGTPWPRATDLVAGLVMGASTAGSYEIGGLVFLGPIFLLCTALAAHRLEAGGRAPRRATSMGVIVLGVLLFGFGVVAMTAGLVIAPIGLLLVAWGATMRR